MTSGASSNFIDALLMSLGSLIAFAFGHDPLVKPAQPNQPTCSTTRPDFLLSPGADPNTITCSFMILIFYAAGITGRITET